MIAFITCHLQADKTLSLNTGHPPMLVTTVTRDLSHPKTSLPRVRMLLFFTADVYVALLAYVTVHLYKTWENWEPVTASEPRTALPTKQNHLLWAGGGCVRCDGVWGASPGVTHGALSSGGCCVTPRLFNGSLFLPVIDSADLRLQHLSAASWASSAADMSRSKAHRSSRCEVWQCVCVNQIRFLQRAAKVENEL